MGAAVQDPSGVIKLLSFIAGVHNFTQYDYYYQTQSMATPTVPASTPDPLFIHWTKADSNPIIPNVPQGGNHSQFRDPMTAWEQVSSHCLPVHVTLSLHMQHEGACIDPIHQECTYCSAVSQRLDCIYFCHDVSCNGVWVPCLALPPSTQLYHAMGLCHMPCLANAGSHLLLCL